MQNTYKNDTLFLKNHTELFSNHSLYKVLNFWMKQLGVKHVLSFDWDFIIHLSLKGPSS